MGISHALLVEVMFDESGITQNNWISYPILKMSDIPEIKVVLLNNPKSRHPESLAKRRSRALGRQQRTDQRQSQNPFAIIRGSERMCLSNGRF